MYRRGTARRAMSVEVLSTAAQLYENPIWKDLHAVSELPWKSLKLIGIAIIWQVIHYFIFTVCSENFPILHPFRDITTFTAYVTACDLEKSFSFDKTIEITSHVRFLIHA